MGYAAPFLMVFPARTPLSRHNRTVSGRFIWGQAAACLAGLLPGPFRESYLGRSAPAGPLQAPSSWDTPYRPPHCTPPGVALTLATLPAAGARWPGCGSWAQSLWGQSRGRPSYVGSHLGRGMGWGGCFAGSLGDTNSGQGW